ncbi:11868_t:CDS:10 [Ambispora leptoticha]|uniref:11868_t:CDS:1 n=1 Tax=Ambispora leptoticha TaxID=144679 RepID=A0A9N8ZUL1_9GLOM|nr:11868_t:CDS:10 [Ambispora leptoticha]
METSTSPTKNEAKSTRAASSHSSQLEIDRHYRPELKFTNFAAQAPIVTKYVTSKYLRNDASFFQRDELLKPRVFREKERERDSKDEDMEDEEEENREGSKVLVIHPGSKNLRIGCASNAFPLIIPHVIARKLKIPNDRSNKVKKDNKENADFMEIDSGTNTNITANTIELLKEGHQVNEETGKNAIIESGGNGSATKEESSNENMSGSPSSLANIDEFEQEEETRIKKGIDEIKKELKERMKIAKRRPVANASAQIASFNKAVVPEIIPDHNDPYKVEWTRIDDGHDYYVGDKALRIPTPLTPYKLLYPIQRGDLNTRDYDSIKAVIGDLETIWTEVITEQLKIKKKNFDKYSVILVIPDLFNRLSVAEIVTMLLRYMGFSRVFVQQEAVCVTFGAGMSMACVVDIGAQTTSITCVEDGMCIPDSRIYLNYGCDDITIFFLRLLKRSRFPYEEIDLNRSYDWMLAEEMKERFCTLNEANLTIQLYDFYVRAPNEPTKKYQIKTYDEAIIAPMLLLYPHIINFQKKVNEFPTKFFTYAIDDINEGNASTGPKLSLITNPSQIRSSSYTSPSPGPRDSPLPSTPVRNEPNTTTTGPSSPSVFSSLSRNNITPMVDPVSTLPLDEAIVQSINCSSTEERVKKFYSSIIVVGGGGLIPGINAMLEDRLSSRPMPFADKLEVLSSPRELDPRLLAWKGASVMSKLEIVNESWINSREWGELGVRCLREKAMFAW